MAQQPEKDNTTTPPKGNVLEPNKELQEFLEERKLSDLVKLFEEQAKKAEQELYEFKSTLIVNFIKPRGNTPKILDESDLYSSPVSILIKIVEYYEQFRKEKKQHIPSEAEAKERAHLHSQFQGQPAHYYNGFMDAFRWMMKTMEE